MTVSKEVTQVGGVQIPAHVRSTVEVSSETLFVPPIPKESFSPKKKAMLWTESASALMVVSVMGTSVSAFVNYAVGIGSASGLEGTIAAGILAVLPFVFGAVAFGSIPLMIWNSKWSKIFDAVQQVNEKSLKVWLAERYGIRVSGSTLEYLGRQVTWHETWFERSEFRDKNKNNYVLITGADNVSYVIKKNDDADVHFDAALVSKTDIFLESLSGEVRVLFESVASRVKLLQEQDLGVEAKHSLARVLNDIKQVIQLREKLLTLGDTDLSTVTSILSALNKELHDVLENEVNQVKHELLVTQAYVKERQLSSRLSLKQGSAVAVPEPVETVTV